MIICWPIIKHAARHHVAPRIVRPIRRVIAARPPVKTVTKWACVVVGTGAAGGGALYGPGLFTAPPPAPVASAPSFSGGLLFPTPGSPQFEIFHGVGAVAPSPDIPVVSLLTPVPTPPDTAIIETLPIGTVSFTPVADTQAPQQVPEPPSALMFLTAIIGLLVTRCIYGQSKKAHKTQPLSSRYPAADRTIVLNEDLRSRS